MKMEN